VGPVLDPCPSAFQYADTDFLSLLAKPLKSNFQSYKSHFSAFLFQELSFSDDYEYHSESGAIIKRCLMLSN